MSETIVEPVIAPQAIDAAMTGCASSHGLQPSLKNTVGDSVPLTVEDLATFLPSLKGSVSANVKVILARYGYSLVEEVKVSSTKSAKKSAAPVALPEAVDGAPCAADYRLSHDSIDHSLCLGRRLDNGEDKRWKPIIYRESQCSSKQTEGSLCKSCHNRQAKYVETGKPGPWNGLITEEPPSWCHMLGSLWAMEKNVKFNGAAASGTETPASETATETVVPEQMPVAAPAPTKSDAKASEKASEKAAAKAAKEAEKAEKEAAKVAEKAKKEAEKAEKAAAKKEKPAAKKTVAAPAPAAETVAAPVKADTSAPVTKTSWELKLINGSLYSVTNGNVYEYDELQQKPGDFVGRLTADETIDSDAEEVMGDESDSE